MEKILLSELAQKKQVVFAITFAACYTVYVSEQFDGWNSDAPALYTLIDYVEI